MGSASVLLPSLALFLSNTSKDVRIYEVRPRNDHRGVDLISDALPFGRLWYGESDAVSNVIETHAHVGEFREF
jgi:hypothetical protein